MGLKLSCTSRSPDQTQAVGEILASVLAPGDVVTLTGDLGSGKTCFVQGAARALGVTAPVTSPSFLLVKEYEGRLPILHVDVYRLGNLQELLDLGYEEFLDPKWVVFIEWGDAVGPLLPDAYLEVEFRHEGADDRAITIVAHGAEWSERMDDLSARLEDWCAVVREREKRKR